MVNANAKCADTRRALPAKFGAGTLLWKISSLSGAPMTPLLLFAADGESTSLVSGIKRLGVEAGIMALEESSYCRTKSTSPELLLRPSLTKCRETFRPDLVVTSRFVSAALAVTGLTVTRRGSCQGQLDQQECHRRGNPRQTAPCCVDYNQDAFLLKIHVGFTVLSTRCFRSEDLR